MLLGLRDEEEKKETRQRSFGSAFHQSLLVIAIFSIFSIFSTTVAYTPRLPNILAIMNIKPRLTATRFPQRPPPRVHQHRRAHLDDVLDQRVGRAATTSAEALYIAAVRPPRSPYWPRIARQTDTAGLPRCRRQLGREAEQRLRGVVWTWRRH
ncbi:hypothetical protein EDC01DRAFT_781404 [Geopyxis carbonaria]|nr:hypothetical protein EDC01DRAFT_781404 [Geopyxis carbonaria]